MGENFLFNDPQIFVLNQLFATGLSSQGFKTLQWGA